VADNPRLLVVDDEEVVCQGCQRIFSGQGFQVETCNDALEGLCLATGNDYAAILLDIKMPLLDGIRFLEELRKTKPNVPVIFITGYPNVQNAASAVRLAAVDYVTKPFTPERITQAVQRLLRRSAAKEAAAAGPASPEVEPWVPAASEFRFLDESWFQPGKEGSVRVGLVLGGLPEATVEAIQLPRVGEVVYRGLPLVGLTMAGQRPHTAPSPVSGVVVAVNEPLLKSPSILWDDPCGQGWLACICPTRLEEDIKRCHLRRVILANADEASAHQQGERLSSLGCQVRLVRGWEDLAATLQDPDYKVLLIDAASFGDHDPELVQRINTAAPTIRIVVVASPGAKWEVAYRKGKIFYYAVEPFDDNEIVDILDSAFRPQGPSLTRVEHLEASAESLSKICITNRDRKRVCLLAAGGLLQQDEGLGWRIAHQLRDRLYSLETAFGDVSVTPTAISGATGTCDRLVVLLAKDTGSLPGSLVRRDLRSELVSVSEEYSGRMTTLVVQPSSPGGGPLEFDARTTAALAELIVQEMILC